MWRICMKPSSPRRRNKEPIKLLLKREDQFVTVTLDYHGGLRYPHLERVATTPDRLDANLVLSKEVSPDGKRGGWES